MHSYMHTFIPIPPISTGMRSPATARRPSQSLMIRSQQPLPQSPMYSPHQYQHQPASGGARTPNSRYNTPSKGLFVHLFTSLMIMVIIMTMMGTDDVHMRTCVCVYVCHILSYDLLRPSSMTSLTPTTQPYPEHPHGQHTHVHTPPCHPILQVCLRPLICSRDGHPVVAPP